MIQELPYYSHYIHSHKKKNGLSSRVKAKCTKCPQILHWWPPIHINVFPTVCSKYKGLVDLYFSFKTFISFILSYVFTPPHKIRKYQWIYMTNLVKYYTNYIHHRRSTPVQEFQMPFFKSYNPTFEAGVQFPAWPQVGKLVVACL